MDTLEIMEYFTAENREHWLEEIGRCEWGAGKYLHSLLSENGGGRDSPCAYACGG